MPQPPLHCAIWGSEGDGRTDGGERGEDRRIHSRSRMPSHIPSWSALRRPVMRLVFPHRMKSASLSWPMNACLHASADGGRRSFSVGGDARWRMSLSGVISRSGLLPEPPPEGTAESVRTEAEMVWLS